MDVLFPKLKSLLEVSQMDGGIEVTLAVEADFDMGEQEFYYSNSKDRSYISHRILTAFRLKSSSGFCYSVVENDR